MNASPAERILSLAAYLDARRRDDVTLADITRDVPGYRDAADAPLDSGSKEWEAVRKKVQRDLDDLEQQWGIEVGYDDAGHCYRLAPPFFSAKERAALISASAVVAVEGLHGGEPGAIGSQVDDRLARVIVQLHDLVDDFRDAIASRTPVTFEHEGRTRRLAPYALGVWRNQWYVAGGDPDHADEMRRFRLDRITTTSDGHLASAGEPGSFAVPDWFDVDKAFDFDPNSWGHDPVLHAEVRVDADYVAALIAEFGGEVVARDAEHSTVALDVRHYESFRNRLLFFRGHAVVESPAELVDQVRAHLRAVASGGAG